MLRLRGLLVLTRCRQVFIDIVNEVKMHQRQPAHCILFCKIPRCSGAKVSVIFWSWKTILSSFKELYSVRKNVIPSFVLPAASLKTIPRLVESQRTIFLSKSAEWNDLRTPVPSSFYTYYLSIVHGASY